MNVNVLESQMVLAMVAGTTLLEQWWPLIPKSLPSVKPRPTGFTGIVRAHT